MAEPSTPIRREPALPPAAGVSNARVSLAPLGPAARFSLRLAPEEAAALGEVCGFPWDLALNRCAGNDARLAARLGPDEWLLIAADADPTELEAALAAALGSRFHSLVDVSHRNAAIEVAGPRATDVLNAGCPLDLRPAAFPEGFAGRTLLGKAEVVLLRPPAGAGLRVECWRSFAPYVLAFLTAAASAEGGAAQ